MYYSPPLSGIFFQTRGQVSCRGREGDKFGCQGAQTGHGDRFTVREGRRLDV